MISIRMASTIPQNRSQVFEDILQKQLEDIKESGLYKRERIITSPQSNLIAVQGGDQKVLNCM